MWCRDSSKPFNSIGSRPHEVLTLPLIFVINYTSSLRLSVTFMSSHTCHCHYDVNSWFMCCKHAMIIPHPRFMIYVLQTCRDHSILIHLMIYVLRTRHDHSILIRSCDLCAANMSWLLVWMFYRIDAMFILVIYVLRTCRDYLFEYFICFHTRSCNLCAANMP